MSPAWTIVMEQAFNVANDRHCCRSPRFTHGCLPLPYQFYGVSPSLSLPPTSPSNHHRFHLFLHHHQPSIQVPSPSLFLRTRGSLVSTRSLYGCIGHNEPVVSAYKRRTRGVVWVEIYELCAHGQREEV